MQAVGLWLPALTRSCQLHNAPTRSWRPAPHPDPCEPQQCPTLSPPPLTLYRLPVCSSRAILLPPPPPRPLAVAFGYFLPRCRPKKSSTGGPCPFWGPMSRRATGGRVRANPHVPPPSKLSPPCPKAHLTATGLPAAPPSAHQAPPSAPQSCATGRSARTNPRVPPKTHPVPFISQRPPARRQPVSHPPTSQLSLHSPACGLSTPHVARVGQAQTPRFP